MILIDKRKNPDGSPLSMTDTVRLLGPCGGVMNLMSSIHLTLTNVEEPVELQGTVDGYPTYFRACWNNWIVGFYHPGTNPRKAEDGDLVVELSGYYDPTGNGNGASTMDIGIACTLIQAGIQTLRNVVGSDA